jgi:putative transposase
MARTARVVVPGLPHHITQRGTRRFDVFRDEADRRDYLALFAESCDRFLLRTAAYCLMTNHVHFVAIPEHADSIHRVFHRVSCLHSKHFNKKYGFVGHLWQERPFSCVLDEPHFWSAIRYVEQNPVRAGMVATPSDYRWSSARAHCEGTPDPLLDPDLHLEAEIPDWKSWIASVPNPDTNKVIRDRTLTGRPCGDSTFVERMGELTNRDFTPRRRGPKPKLRVT